MRMAGRARVELAVVHPTGIAEVSEGTLEDSGLQLRSTAIVRTGTAKIVVAIERDLFVGSETLRYALRMSAVGQPLTHHLAAELQRIE